MVRGENQYHIVTKDKPDGHIVIGVKKTAIDFRDKYHPDGQIYLTWSEKTGHTMELIE